MKRLLPLILISFVFTRCDEFGPKAKVRTEIKKLMDQKLNDPKSYEAVSTGEAEPDSTYYLHDPQFQLIEDSLKLLQKLRDSLSVNKPITLQDYDGYFRISDSVYNAITRKYDALARFRKTFVRKPRGFCVKHVFRYKNQYGAMITDSARFTFDSSYVLRPENYSMKIRQ